MIAKEMPKSLRCGGCLWSMYMEVSPKDPDKVKYKCLNEACKESDVEYFVLVGRVELKRSDDAGV